MTSIYGAISHWKILPVIAIDEVSSAIPLADALIEGGLPLAEITFRTTAAAEVLQTLKRERPALLVGAGTILSVENLQVAKACGAEFGLAPGLNPIVAAEALRIGFPFAPGIATPSEVEQALELRIKVLKFFPAGDMGGPRRLTSLSGPYAHTGVKFIPTGGVTMDNLKDYFSVKTIMAVGGTWIAKREDIIAGNWDKIRNNCRNAVSLIEQMKTEK